MAAAAPAGATTTARARATARSGARSGAASVASAAAHAAASRPTTTIDPPDASTASRHSVVPRRTRHGVPSQAASRWTPPESVSTAAACSWSASDVRYPTGGTTRMSRASVMRGVGQGLARARMQGQDDRPVRRRRGGQDARPGAHGRRGPVLGAVDGGVEVAARGELRPAGQAQVGRDRRQDRRVAHLRHEAGGQVLHQVAHQGHPVGDAFPGQVGHRGGRRGEAPPAEVIGHHPVDLLGHRPVEAAQAGFHVGQRQAQLGRRQGAGEGRVGVAVDHHRVGRRGGQQGFQRLEHAAGLLAVPAPADAEAVLRLGQAELIEEAAGHGVVPVLAGVDQRGRDARAQERLERRRLDQLRPRARRC